MDELCQALETKQNSFEELQQSLIKKEQVHNFLSFSSAFFWELYYFLACE